jgi:hypothetical protein
VEERVSSAYGSARCRRSPLDADASNRPAYHSSGVTNWVLGPRPDEAWRPSRSAGCSSFRRVAGPQCIPPLGQRVLAKDRAIPTPARCGGARGSRRSAGCSRLLVLLVETTTQPECSLATSAYRRAPRSTTPARLRSGAARHAALPSWRFPVSKHPWRRILVVLLNFHGGAERCDLHGRSASRAPARSPGAQPALANDARLGTARSAASHPTRRTSDGRRRRPKMAGKRR